MPRRLPHAILTPGLLSVAALGCAVQVNFGQYDPAALPWLGAALAGVVLWTAKPIGRSREGPFRVAVVACLALQFALLFSRSPGATGTLSSTDRLFPFYAGLAVGSVLTAAGLTMERWRSGAMVGLLVTHALLGLWVLRAAPDPGVDVAVFQREGAAALLRGENPYAITFRDPYADSSRFYGPGVSVNGRLQFGYPYPPLTLLLTTPVHLLGDFRYAQLVAMTLAGALVAWSRPGKVAFAGAALLLFTPRGFFVLEAGWTEPFAVLFLAATVFALCRSPRWVAVPLGLLLASKQYLVLALLATPLLPDGRSWIRTVGGALPIAAAVTLPMALWDLPAFMCSAVTLQFHQPFRDDALSFLVPLARATGATPPAWIALALAAGAAFVAVRKLPRSASGFTIAVAFIFLVFFAFNKQAFCNYYHFVIAALCCAIAASPGPEGFFERSDFEVAIRGR